MKTRIFTGAFLGAALFLLGNLSPCLGQETLGLDLRPNPDVAALHSVGPSFSASLDGSVAPWLTQDIGEVGIPGNAVLSNGTFQVSGSGNDIWGSSDEFRFVYLPLSGDGTIVARIVSVGNTDPVARAGVMFRQSVASGAVNAAVIVTAAKGTGLTYRNVPNGTTFIQGDSGQAPYWVKMNRSGSKFTGFISSDGVNWKQVAQPDIVMGETVLVGLCVTAHNNAALNTSVFDNVAVTGVTNVLPSTLPPPWVNNDVGSVGLAGSASYDNGDFAVSGSGADIWGSSDAFQFVWQPLLGDGTIIARVVSVGNSDPASRGGVMFRQSLAPGSVNAAVIVTASKGTGLTYRNQPDGTTFIQGDSGQAPYWVRMDRVGRKFTGYISFDGLSWKAIAQPDISMSDPVLVGLCVTAHNNNALNATHFDNVAVIQANSWISPVSGEWHVPTSWSLGVRPDFSQTAIFVTNAGSKVVSIDATARDNYPDSLTVKNLTVGGVQQSINTVSIDRIGNAIPFQVFDLCDVNNGGVILNRDSVFQVRGANSILRLNGGRIFQSGGSNIFENICSIGFGTNNGGYFLTNGTTRTPILRVGDQFAGTATGEYVQYDGATIAGEITIGSTSSFADFNLHNGSMSAGNVTVGLGPYNGSFFQTKGLATITNLNVGSRGGATYLLSDGSLVTKTVIVGNQGDGTFTQVGGIHKNELLAWNPDPHATGRYFLNDGFLYSKTNHTSDPGVMDQSGGSNVVDELIVEGYYLLGGGLLQSSNVTIAGGRRFGGALSQTGGTHVMNHLMIDGSRLFLGTGYFLGGGDFTSGSIELDGASGVPDDTCLLNHAGGSLTNLGDFIFAGGQLNANSATGYLGTLLLKGVGRSYIVCSTDPCVERFSSSAQKSWDSGPNTLLMIVDWRGSITGGGLHQIYVGNSAEGLTPTQVGQVRFLYRTGQILGARILDTGELVPDALPPVSDISPTLSSRLTAKGLILDWPTNYTLQTATNVDGPYYDLIGVFGPLTNSFTEEHRFFRLRQ